MNYLINQRRFRRTKVLRDSFSVVDVLPNNMIQPYFIYQGLKESVVLDSIYNQQKHNKDSLLIAIENGIKNGIHNVLLFFIPDQKSESEFSYDFELDVIQTVKSKFKDEIVIYTDMCLCSQTKSGHCGIVDSNGNILNHKSVVELANKSLMHAQAGSDVISPSDMMDDRVKAIRTLLDAKGFDHTMIMSYSTKFSSNLYGPFRAAADSTPEFGNRKSYQIDFRNEYDAINSSLRDKKQGADILMVKPAGMYLDIIAKLRHHPILTNMPIAAYQVSGEYQGLYVMSKERLIDFNKGIWESLVAIKRSGANLIISYAANQLLEIKKNI